MASDDDRDSKTPILQLDRYRKEKPEPEADKPEPGAKAKEVALPSEMPCDIAKHFVVDRYTAAGLRTLLYWQEQFWCWRDNRWCTMDPDTMRSQMYRYLDGAKVVELTRTRTYSPKAKDVYNAIDALKARVNLEPGVVMPA
jgi:hypothetical protein